MRTHSTAIALLLTISCLSGSSLASTTSLQWTWGNPTPSGDAFNVVAYGNGIYVAAGQDGVLYSSSDGAHWSPQSNAIGNGGQYLDAIYGGGKFLVAGQDGDGIDHFTVSSDGVHWTDTKVGLPTNSSIRLTYGGSTFLAMLNATVDVTSSDGVNWTTHAIGFTPLGAAKYANGVFAVFGPAINSSHFSVDGGVHWTASATTIKDYSLISMVSTGSAFFSFGFSSVSTSTDGSNWTSTHYNTAAVDGSFIDAQVFWDGNQFLTVLNKGGAQTPFSSSDGVTWTQGTPVSGPPPISGSVSAGSGYIAAGSGPLTVLKSADFDTWTTAFVGTNSPMINFNDMIYAGGRYVAVGGTPTGAGIMESSNGLTWKSVYTDSSGTHLATVIYGNGVYVAAGNGASGLWLSSTDGVHWNALANSPPPNINQLAYGNGVFAGFTGTCSSPLTNCSSVSSVTSPDGLNWTTHALPVDFTAANAFNAISYTGTHFLALGNSEVSNKVSVFTSNDGVNWMASSSFSAPPTIFYRIRHLANGVAALGMTPQPGDGPWPSGETYPVIAISSDGSSWSAATISQLTQPGLTQSFPDIAFDGANYYATTANLTSGINRPAIATSADAVHWNGTNGAPVNAQLTSLAINGKQIVAAGAAGYIGAVLPVASSSGGGSGSSSGKSGGGEFGLLSLAALLGFSRFRRRRHGRSA